MKVAALRDPIAFQKYVLNRRLWSKQKAIIRSVVENPITAVKGAHGTGKTHASTGIIPWWLVRYRYGKVFTTAPTLRQVKSHWREIAAARMRSQLATQILPIPTATGMYIDPERYAEGASASAGVNIQGFHSPNVLIFCDEAPGIDGDIWQSIEGIRASGHVRVLMLGNPTVPSGRFFDAFTRDRAITSCISISAFDTPNFQAPDGHTITEDELMAMDKDELNFAPYPELISRSWVKERLIVWGPKHPQYLSRVLAEFPQNDPYSVFELSWIEAAKRDPTPDEIRRANQIGVIQVGIDVAGAGADETTMCVRVGGIILEQHAWPDPDPRGAVTAALVRISQGKYLQTPQNTEWIGLLRPMQLGGVVVDTIGIGYNFALHLGDQGFPIWGLNAQARPVDARMYSNQKAEVYFTCREAMKRGDISGLYDEECAAQLSSIRYSENSHGLVEIESKDMRNKRGIPGSPDRCESLIFSTMRITPAEMAEVYNPSGYQISAI